MNQSFGIMDPGYFKSKKELLEWISQYLQLKVDKIDHLGTGSVFCQILDATFPGQVPLHKVNWFPKTDYEYLLNFKVLTTSMHKLGVIKCIDVNKLVKCRTQDNLELCQWLKRLFEVNSEKHTEAYDPVARRGGKPTPYDFGLFEGKDQFSPEFQTLDSLKKSKSKFCTSAKKNTTSTMDFQNEKNPAKFPNLNDVETSNNQQQENKIVSEGTEQTLQQKATDIMKNADYSDSDKIREMKRLLNIEESRKNSVVTKQIATPFKQQQNTISNDENANPNTLPNFFSNAKNSALKTTSENKINLSNGINNNNINRTANSCFSFNQSSQKNVNFQPDTVTAPLEPVESSVRTVLGESSVAQNVEQVQMEEVQN